MHGAGLTHAIFLPPKAALIELTPSSYYSSNHFAAIASWRRLHYQRWVGASINDASAIIEPSIVGALIAKAVNATCPADRAVAIGARMRNDGR
jgi:capsular polysaccharide biosynthesis protein